MQGSNYPGTKGHQGGINWIPICASSHQVSLLGLPLVHAKDSTVVIRSLIAWSLCRRWNQSLVLQQDRMSTADQWGADGVLKQWSTPNIIAQCCAKSFAARLEWLTCVCIISGSLQRWLCSVQLQPFNSHSYPGQQWGMRLLVKTLAN